jgi:DNA repair exonuclease SbcCD ATPase subunit
MSQHTTLSGGQSCLERIAELEAEMEAARNSDNGKVDWFRARIAELEARIKRDEKYRDELLERRAESVERAEKAEAELHQTNAFLRILATELKLAEPSGEGTEMTRRAEEYEDETCTTCYGRGCADCTNEDGAEDRQITKLK